MYSPFKIGGLEIKNRLVRSATFEYGAEEGRITPRIVDLYRQLAEGGVGLIITGMVAVRPQAGTGSVMVNAAYEGFADDMRQVSKAAHESGSKLFVQLNHAGYRTAQAPFYDRIGVSPLDAGNGVAYHEATPDELKELGEAFGKAAKRCQEAGCDGVQIHAAHGFLLSTFLSPYYNLRTDAYGGPIENRARVLFEVYEAIRAKTGDGYPIGVKLHFSDRVSPSITPEESLHVCRELEKRGIGMIEVSSGIFVKGQKDSVPTPPVPDGQEGNFLSGAKQIAEAVNVPVISVCGYRTPDFIEKTLAGTSIAAVSLCRPLVREPGLPNRWKTDRSKATCVSCSRCFLSKGIIACQKDK
jgi:2,4-dienoyl-CoA reductase-like NADH-dependent reductase (Old Yellow Enzyme family)